MNEGNKNTNEERFFVWMKTFLYLTDDYTIENLEIAYFEETLKEIISPVESKEPQKKNQPDNCALFKIYSDFNMIGLDDTVLMNKFNMKSLILLDSLDDSGFFPRHKQMNNSDNGTYERLYECSPENIFSTEYQIRFFKTLLRFVLEKYQADGDKVFDDHYYDLLRNKCGPFHDHFEICMKMLQVYMANIPILDRSKDSVLHALRKYRSNIDFTPFELAQVWIFGQILSLQIRLEYAIETGEWKEKFSEEKIGDDGGQEKAFNGEIIKPGEIEKEAVALMAYDMFKVCLMQKCLFVK